MDNTISRQAAIDEIDEWIKAFRENGHKESAADARLIQDGIIKLPSAQPEIIRCKDCKWYQPDADKWCGYFECMGFESDDYCSQGERKGGERHG